MILHPQMDPDNFGKIAIIIVVAIYIVVITRVIKQNAEYYRIFHVDSDPFQEDVKYLFENKKNNELYFLQVFGDKIQDTQYYIYDRYMLLGAGYYANVYVGYNLKTKEKVAVKKFRYDSEKRELETLKRVKQFIGFTKDEYGRDHIILKYFPGIPYEYLIRYSKLTQEELIYLFNLVISKLNEIHDLGIIHNDCHLLNILIDYYGEHEMEIGANGNSSEPKICTDRQPKNKFGVAFVDFGSATLFNNHKGSEYYRFLTMKEILYLIEYTIKVYGHYFSRYDQFGVYLENYRWYTESMISRSGY